LLEEVILKEGVKVVIADKECGITYQRRVRREKKKVIHDQGYLPEEHFINITPEVCEFCLECTNATGCPGLAIDETLHGPRSLRICPCVWPTGACAKGKVCPSFEEVVVRRERPAAPLPGQMDPPLPARAPARARHVVLLHRRRGRHGVGRDHGHFGSSGSHGRVSRFVRRQKGLAIRNGGVYGHVIFSKDGKNLRPLVPYGRADLLDRDRHAGSGSGVGPQNEFACGLLPIGPPRWSIPIKCPPSKRSWGKTIFPFYGLESYLKRGHP
jgi:indolepyruvate ferredoxin oxidoreductase